MIIEDDPRSYTPGDITPQRRNFQSPSGDGPAYKDRIPEGDPPPKEVATNEGSVRLGPQSHRPPVIERFDRGVTDLNYSPPSREFTVATALSCRIQKNCSRQVCSFIR